MMEVNGGVRGCCGVGCKGRGYGVGLVGGKIGLGYSLDEMGEMGRGKCG